jgi:hypothetical protein
MQLEVELWNAINSYAIAVGGDPSRYVYGYDTRMRAVAEVGKIIDKVRSRQRIDDIVVEDLVRGSNAASAAACARGAEISRLRAALIDVRGFLRGVARRPELGRGAKDLLDEAEMLDCVLGEKKEMR